MVVVGALVDTSDISVDAAIRSRLASVTGGSASSVVVDEGLCLDAPAAAEDSASSSLVGVLSDSPGVDSDDSVDEDAPVVEDEPPSTSASVVEEPSGSSLELALLLLDASVVVVGSLDASELADVDELPLDSSVVEDEDPPSVLAAVVVESPLPAVVVSDDVDPFVVVPSDSLLVDDDVVDSVSDVVVGAEVVVVVVVLGFFVVVVLGFVLYPRE